MQFQHYSLVSFQTCPDSFAPSTQRYLNDYRSYVQNLRHSAQYCITAHRDLQCFEMERCHCFHPLHNIIIFINWPETNLFLTWYALTQPASWETPIKWYEWYCRPTPLTCLQICVSTITTCEMIHYSFTISSNSYGSIEICEINWFIFKPSNRISSL